ncbi:MAG: hypothetical protein AVO35_09140 [Candidatus Aegiribacteria sp. MLS_C]|nr:MAG: hypothetical protein AVO35_09140 [Candidatus Aegiribacteria sp. MLS_C]
MKDKPEGRLVEVALNRPLWQTFTYSIPAGMCGGDMAGCRVAVPFGSDRLVGYVWKEEAPVPAVGMEIREVLERLDSAPLLPPDVMRMVRWAAEYYCAPPGMMMAAAHPPGISGRVERVVELIGDLDPSHPLSPLLPSAGTVGVSVLRDSLDSNYPLEKALASLEKSGILTVYWRSVSGPRPVTERIVEPAMEADVLVRRAQSLKAAAPRQAELLLQLATREGPVDRSSLLRSSGAPAASLDALVRKGLVRESRRRRYREPRLAGDMGDARGGIELNGAQLEAIAGVSGTLDRRGVFLLHGVTGSGKTEVYLRLIEKVLSNDLSALVMVPEISLTPLTVSRFSRRFPGQVAVLHSGMSPGERLDSWNLIRSGRRRIAIGPRSAVFAPLRDLGMIIVDEEHDSSYKQDELPHYNGRDLAVLRGRIAGVPVLLGSASPSMESYGNAMGGRYRLLELPDRVDGIPLPVTRIVEQDRESDIILSSELLDSIEVRRKRSEQSIVLINRRGFSPTQMCRNCGHREECPNCGVTLTYHRKGRVLRCHYCSFWKPAMRTCPECGFNEFSHMGPGIQKVEETLKSSIPGLSVMRMDADTTRGKDAHWRILSAFASGDGDVLLGTQMVAKGHDFPSVTFVGVVAADMGLAFPDFRAAERTFQLILQVAGRSGRGRLPGEVLIQAYDVRNPVIKAASEHDFRAFWEMESRARKTFGYPPFGHLVRFVWSGLDAKRVQRAAEKALNGMEMDGVMLSEPAEAAFPRINRRWRWNAIARSASRQKLGRLAGLLRERHEKISSGGVRLDIDIDPHNLL